MHDSGARAAVERGYNVLAFDGPGQFGPQHREGLHFRPDWEKVITPVVDFALKLPGIDPGKIALMGISFGGELAPRAAAFEKRIAALIANDGIYDYGAANLALVPAELRSAFLQMLTAKEAPQVDAMIEASMKASPRTDWGITQGMYAMGAPTARPIWPRRRTTICATALRKPFPVGLWSAKPKMTSSSRDNPRNFLTTSLAPRPCCASPTAKARDPIARSEPAAWSLPACMTGSTKPFGSTDSHNRGSPYSVLAENYEPI